MAESRKTLSNGATLYISNTTPAIGENVQCTLSYGSSASMLRIMRTFVINGSNSDPWDTMKLEYDVSSISTVITSSEAKTMNIYGVVDQSLNTETDYIQITFSGSNSSGGNGGNNETPSQPDIPSGNIQLHAIKIGGNVYRFDNGDVKKLDLFNSGMQTIGSTFKHILINGNTYTIVEGSNDNPDDSGDTPSEPPIIDNSDARYTVTSSGQSFEYSDWNSAVSKAASLSASNPVTVNINGTVRFTNGIDISQNFVNPVTFKGGIFTGGKLITGWTKESGNIWKAPYSGKPNAFYVDQYNEKCHKGWKEWCGHDSADNAKLLKTNIALTQWSPQGNGEKAFFIPYTNNNEDDKIVLAKKLFPEGTNLLGATDIELYITVEWKVIRLLIKNVTEDTLKVVDSQFGNKPEENIPIKVYVGDPCWVFHLKDRALVHNMKNLPSLGCSLQYIAFDNGWNNQGGKYLYSVQVRNSKNFLISNGQWYADSNYIYLYSTIDPNTLNCEAVVSEKGIHIANSKNITFDGCTFKHFGNDLVPNYTYVGNQATNYCVDKGRIYDENNRPVLYFNEVDDNIHITDSENITIKNCHIYQIDGDAITVYKNTKNVTIDSNRIQYIDGSAIVVGDCDTFNLFSSDQGVMSQKYLNGTEFIPENTTIHNNLIQHIGLGYYMSAGIYLNCVNTATISNNTIENTSHCGIAGGGALSGGNPETETGAHFIPRTHGRINVYRNLVRYTQFRSNDSSCIYFTAPNLNDFAGKSNVGLWIHENYCAFRSDDIPMGMKSMTYLDEGTAHALVENNIMMDTNPTLHPAKSDTDSEGTSCMKVNLLGSNPNQKISNVSHVNNISNIDMTQPYPLNFGTGNGSINITASNNNLKASYDNYKDTSAYGSSLSN